MRFDFERIGFIDKGSVELADLTLICGPNSVGKTYVTYSIYGFIEYFKRFINLAITNEQVKLLKNEGSLDVDLSLYQENLTDYLTQASKVFTAQLEDFFKVGEDFFINPLFRFSDENFCIDFEKKYQRIANFGSNESIIFDKEAGQKTLSVAHQRTDTKKRGLPSGIVANLVGEAIFDTLFGNFLPKPFVITSERTGVALFRVELDTRRNRIVEYLSESDEIKDPFELLERNVARYMRPVHDNLDTMRDVKRVANQKSFIRRNPKKYKKLLGSLKDLLGGEFIIDVNGQIFFVPKKESARAQMRIPLSMTSSSVKSLFFIDLYINYSAKENGLLIIDEPELNLHPNNQRKMASLLAQLVNAGVKVLITTHSDFLIREINSRIMLSGEVDDKQRILEDWEIVEQEILQPNQVKAYSFKPNHTVEEATVDKYGINIQIFDGLIADANNLSNDIYYNIEN